MSRREEIFKNFIEYDYLVKERTADIEKYRKGDATLLIKDKDGNEIKDASVEYCQKSHEFEFGANIFMLDEMESEEKNVIYKEKFASLFNLATLPFYWCDLEPKEGELRFTKDSKKIYRRPAPDLCIEYCKEHSITPKAHCLNYDQWTPLWADGKSSDEIKYLLEKRFFECAERYKDKIHSWEVTNETFCGYVDIPEQNRKSSAFFDDDNFVEWSFKTARKYFPDNELIINEAAHVWDWFSIFDAPTRNAYYLQISKALERGAPIDSIGIQYHDFNRAENENLLVKTLFNPQVIYKGLDALSTLKDRLQITEITMPAYDGSKENEDIQAELIKRLYTIWFSHKNVTTAVYWNLVDGYTAFAPLGDMSAGENYFGGGLLRFDMSEKPAYKTLYNLIHKEWHSEGVTKNNEFCGFYGKYDLKIHACEKTFTRTIDLKSNKDNVFEIVAD